jgi:prepilin-type N-terminal cleavage/methylation domain-containing protein
VTRARSLLHRLAAQSGYSLVELMTVMVILSTVLTSVTGLFVAGTKSEVDLQNRFDVQSSAVTTLARLRRDVHCASVAVVSGDTVTLTTPCTSSLTVRWCAKGTTGRYRLYRREDAGGTCSDADTPFADYLLTNTPFSYSASTIDSLAKLKVNLSARDSKTMTSAFTLCDLLVLRNSKRENTTGETVTPC